MRSIFKVSVNDHLCQCVPTWEKFQNNNKLGIKKKHVEWTKGTHVFSFRLSRKHSALLVNPVDCWHSGKFYLLQLEGKVYQVTVCALTVKSFKKISQGTIFWNFLFIGGPYYFQMPWSCVLEIKIAIRKDFFVQLYKQDLYLTQDLESNIKHVMERFMK